MDFKFHPTSNEDFGDDAEDLIAECDALCRKYLGKPYTECVTVCPEDTGLSQQESAAMYTTIPEMISTAQPLQNIYPSYWLTTHAGQPCLIGDQDGIPFLLK